MTLATDLAQPAKSPIRPTHDTTLLAACREFTRLHYAVLAAAAAMSATLTDDALPELEQALRQRWEVSDRLQALRPVTTRGRQAKATVAAVLLEENDSDDAGSMFALAALREIAGMAS